MDTLLRVSAGRGPVEVCRFVAALGAYLAEQGARERERKGEPPRSLLVELAGGEGWTGTHELVAPMRGRGARKRWFVRVDLVQPPEEKAPIAPEHLRVHASRAGGPGGQNVNKRSTAVRATHTPSGLQVRATEERSQARNRALALDKLERALALRADAADRQARGQLRALDDSLVRGQARFRWRLRDDGSLQPA